MTKMMQAATISHYHQATPKIMTVPQPILQPNDVLVKVIAASINPIDQKVMAGELKLLLTYKMPLILGNDFAGEVVAVGSKVTQFKLGDAVYGRPQKQRIGTFAEYLAVDVADIALKPRNLSYQAAAAIPLVGLTSYQALHDLMQLKPGQKVLIQAGAGGIGTIAIQLAKQLGAWVATTTSAKNIALVKQLGADQVIDYHKTNFTTILRDYDAVFDTLGGRNLEQAFQIIKPGGHVVSISGLPNQQFTQAYGLPHWKQWLFKLAAHRLTHLANQAKATYHFLFMKPSGKQLELLTKLIENDQIKPIIDQVFEFKALDQAFAYSSNGHARGKIIVNIGYTTTSY